jgi:NifU homolog involved in Fe-S cluster formation
MEEDKLYDLIDLYRNPLHYGKPTHFNLEEEGYSPSCGDRFIVYLDVENELIKDASFEGSGCVVSTVAASKLCSYIIGRGVKDVDDLGVEDIKRLLGLTNISAARVKCSLVGLNAVKSALHKSQD